MLHFATDCLFPSFAIFSNVNGFSDFCFKFGLKITMSPVFPTFVQKS